MPPVRESSLAAADRPAGARHSGSSTRDRRSLDRMPATDELDAAGGHALLADVRPEGDECRIVGMTHRASPQRGEERAQRLVAELMNAHERCVALPAPSDRVAQEKKRRGPERL